MYMLKKNIEEIGYGKTLFNGILKEMKKDGIKDFEIVVETKNYIIRKLIESKESLLVSKNNGKVKYAVKI